MEKRHAYRQITHSLLGSLLLVEDGGIRSNFRSKVRNHLVVNNTLEPHPWQKSDLTDPSGGDALYGFGVYPSGVGYTKYLEGFPINN